MPMKSTKNLANRKDRSSLPSFFSNSMIVLRRIFYLLSASSLLYFLSATILNTLHTASMLLTFFTITGSYVFAMHPASRGKQSVSSVEDVESFFRNLPLPHLYAACASLCGAFLFKYPSVHLMFTLLDTATLPLLGTSYHTIPSVMIKLLVCFPAVLLGTSTYILYKGHSVNTKTTTIPKTTSSNSSVSKILLRTLSNALEVSKRLVSHTITSTLNLLSFLLSPILPRRNLKSCVLTCIKKTGLSTPDTPPEENNFLANTVAVATFPWFVRLISIPFTRFSQLLFALRTSTMLVCAGISAHRLYVHAYQSNFVNSKALARSAKDYVVESAYNRAASFARTTALTRVLKLIVS